MGVLAHRIGNERCWSCWAREEADRTQARADQIAVWWDAGESMKQIAGRFGWSVNHLANEFDRIRRKDPDLLPYRYNVAAARRVA
jgi:lambda repressor-like predicted transcriptional regulator